MSSSAHSHPTARLGLAVGASLVLLISSLPGAVSARPGPAQPGRIDPDLYTQAAANPSGKVRVIITRERSGSKDDDVRQTGGNVVHKLQMANATAAEVPASALDSLAAQPGVVRVSYDAPLKVQSLDPVNNCCAQLQTAYPLAVGSASQWNAPRSLRGAGVGVAILDSGVQSRHPDFQNAGLLGSRVLQVLNGITGSSGSGEDDNGHGTFVAGIIGGRGWGVPGLVPSGSYIGTAPDANIISVKVADKTGRAYVSDVIAGIEWVARNRQANNIRVLNLSLVSNAADSYRTDMLDAAVELAWFQGLVVVVAAGNAGPNAKITSPANDPFAIVVGATDDKGTATIADDSLAAFSSYGTTADQLLKPDLVAPGRHLVSTLSSPTAPLALQFPARVLGGGSYINLSGTSASAPVVSGLVAQLLQARPELSPGQVKWLLTHTARPVAGPGTGAGYPNLGAAVNYPYGVPSANGGRLPNQYLLAAYLAKAGRTWNSVSWDSVSWDSVSWDSVSWDSVSWDSVSWDSVSWDSVAWDSVAWLPAD
jgi:serine protease AprX